MSLREWKNAKQCWIGKVNKLNGNKLFFPLNFFLAGKKCLKKQSSRLTSRLPKKFYRPFPWPAPWFRKPVKKTSNPPDGFAEVTSYCHVWKGSPATSGRADPHDQTARGEPTSARTQHAGSELSVSQLVSRPPVSPKSPPSLPATRLGALETSLFMTSRAILIDALAKERLMLQSLNLVLRFQWC